MLKPALLIQKLIGSEDLDDVDRSKKKEKLVLDVIVSNIAILILRLVIGSLSNSMAMYTTAAKSIVSVFAMAISWFALRRVRKGENDVYNYGYGKLESVSGALRAAALLVTFAIVIFTSLERLKTPVTLNTTGAIIAIAFLLFTTGGNIYRLLRIKNLIAIGDRSPVLFSQSKATTSTILVNAGSLIAVILSIALAGQPWAVYIDPVVSLLLSGYILVTAYSILSSSIQDLMDKTLDEDMQLIIVRALADHFDDYSQIVSVKSRSSGGLIFVEITLEFDGHKTIAEIQGIIDRIQKSLESKIKDSRVTIIPKSAIAC